jgi:hypothetical protein
MTPLSEDQKNWLLDSDAAIRWQVKRNLLGASPDEVAADRTRITKQGWGAQLLAVRDPDGQWAGGACFPGDFRGSSYKGQPWISTFPVLALLMEFGVDPADPAITETIALVRENCKWEHAGQRFFDGEVEPCINGRTVSIGAYFGVKVDGIVELLLGEQLEDGGWNCEAENGSIRSSFNTTICVLEGLLEYERHEGTVPLDRVQAARRRAEEYLLDRSLFRRASNKEIINEDFLKLSYPWWWHYDILRALDYFRASGRCPDPRMAEAIEMLRAKQLADGLWPLENIYQGKTYFTMEEGIDKPSRWNTLRALRVLRWYDQAHE